jgi:hypothetical protein
MLAVIGVQVWAQSSAAFDLELEELSMPNAPSVQSYAWGQHAGKWLIIGGRRDGLHQRQPFAAFLAADNNLTAFVIDPVAGQVWSQSLNNLPQGLKEQLQATNPNYVQRGDMLYITGGYGYSDTQADHYTYPNLAAVNVPDAIDAIVAGTNMASAFRQITDSRMQVTGGQMGMINDTFYLAGGQKFIGRYNPMGPTHGPGFVQEYTNEVRKFTIQDNGTTLSIGNYQALHDTMELHRRDYNMMPQVFPDGQHGYTMFTGVFQHAVDLPWLNCVDLRGNSYQVVPGFEQLLSQYQSAKLGVYEQSDNKMHSIFFGGMARYHFDGQGLVDDQNVPFVKTISRVTRFSNDSLMEYDTGLEMPGFLGAGSEFIPLESQPWVMEGVLDLDQLAAGRQLVGYIYGGIESTAENIFFINTGVESHASNRIFKVFITPTATGRPEPKSHGSLDIQVIPNPNDGHFKVKAHVSSTGNYELSISDVQGKLLRKWSKRLQGNMENEELIDMSSFPSGLYFLNIHNAELQLTEKVELRK